jgi:hypothetical protein
MKMLDDPIASQLEPRQLVFCEEYLKSNNPAEAYVKAGYKVTNNRSARAASGRLLSNVAVRAYIAREREAAIKTSQLDRGAILERLMKIGMGDIEEDVVTKAQVAEDSKGRPIYEAVVVKKKPSARDQSDVLIYLNKYLIQTDMAVMQVSGAISTDQKILTALRTRKVSGDEPDTPPQEEQSDANDE